MIAEDKKQQSMMASHDAVEAKAQKDEGEDGEGGGMSVEVTPEIAASLALMSPKDEEEKLEEKDGSRDADGDGMVKAKAKEAARRPCSSSSPTRHQDCEDQMAKGGKRHSHDGNGNGVGQDGEDEHEDDRKPEAAPVRHGAYCEAPGAKTERRESLQYAAVDGHLDACGGSNRSITSSGTTSSRRRSTATTTSCGGDICDREGMRESALREMEERKFLVDSLGGMDDSEQQQQQQVEQGQQVEEQVQQQQQEEDEERDNNNRHRRTSRGSSIPGTTALTSSTTSSISDSKRLEASVRSNGTSSESVPGSFQFRSTTAGMDDSSKSHASNIIPGTSETTATTSGGSSSLAQLPEDISYSQLPIAAKLVVEETESELFNRISDMYMRDASNASCASSHHSHHSHHSSGANSFHSHHSNHPLPLAELVTTTNSGGPFGGGGNKRWMMLSMIAIVLLVGALIGVIVGLTASNKSNDSDNTDNQPISTITIPDPQQQQFTDVPKVVLNTTTTAAEATTPRPVDTTTTATMAPTIPVQPPQLFIPSQCILLNYPEVVAFNQSQRLQDPALAHAPETICYDRLPHQGWSTHCPPQPLGSGATNLVAQSQLWYVNSQMPPQSSNTTSNTTIIALVNAGQIKRDFCQGDFTLEMAHIMFPYDNRMVQIPAIRGQTLLDLLEEGIEQLYVDYLDGLNGAGGYPYTAGLRFDLNMSASYPNRLSNVQVHTHQHQQELLLEGGVLTAETKDNNDDDGGVWISIDPNANYTLVTNSWMADGGDGYTILGQAFVDNNGMDTGVITRDVFMDYSQHYLNGVLLEPPLADYSTQHYIHDSRLFNITTRRRRRRR